MHAVEFEAEAHDRMIEIPEQYSEFAGKHLRVVAMIEDEYKNSNPEFHNYDKQINSALASIRGLIATPGKGRSLSQELIEERRKECV